MSLSLLVVLISGLLACNKEEEATYSQFNGNDDSLTIQVGAASELDPVVIELTSTTGEVVVGAATVDPGGGPVGTEHAIVVEVYDDYQHIVDRVSIRLDAGSRGEDEFELTQDSADEGVWKTTLVSAGEADEVREDTLTVRCWDLDGDDDAEAGTSSDDSGD